MVWNIKKEAKDRSNGMDEKWKKAAFISRDSSTLNFGDLSYAWPYWLCDELRKYYPPPHIMSVPRSTRAARLKSESYEKAGPRKRRKVTN